MTYYKSKRPIDGKPPIWIIVDKNGNAISKNPTKVELKDLEIFETNERYILKRNEIYTDEELLDYPIQFYEKYGRIPTATDFSNNRAYPHRRTYEKRFGSWFNSLKLAGLDIDLMGRQGSNHRARLAEIKVINHFKLSPIDLSGDDLKSPCDGICPNGKTYDVKSSKLHEGRRYHFNTRNRYKDEIEIYYFLAFNSYWTKLQYAWRVPGELIEKDNFNIGLTTGYELNIENMKEYEITDSFRDLL